MSDYDIPELPSDEELGISEEDRRAYEEEAGDAEETATPPPSDSSRGPSASDGPPDAPPPEAPAQGPPPLGGARGPVTLAVLLALTVVATQWWALPSPAPANAPDTAFSSARAMTQLVDIAARPHPVGSPDHARVRGYLEDALRDLGLEPTVQTTTGLVRGGEVVRAATVRNIVARLPGTDPTGTLLLTAHYDTRELAPGAGDDGIGLVTILETLRALRRSAPMRNDVLVLFTDAEELGLLGMRGWLREGRRAEDVDLALSLEMRGGGGVPLMFQTGSANGWVVRRFAETVRSPVANSLFEEIYRRMPNDTDFTPLKDAGVQGLAFAGIGRANVYHQPLDRPEEISEATLQHYGEQILPLVKAFGSADLRSVDAPDATWFTLPFVGMVVYGDAVTWGLSGILLLVWVGLVLVGRRSGRVRWSGLGAGAGLLVLVGGVAWFGAAALVGWVSGFHPEQTALAGSAFHREGAYVLALVAGVVTLVTALLGPLRRRVGLASLTLGGAVVPVLAAVGLSGVAPQVAPNLQWPVLAALLGAGVSLGAGPGRRTGVVPWVLSLALAAPILWLLAALVELLWMGLTITLAPALAVLVTVTLVLLLPALDVLREPNRWWAPVASLVAAGAFLGLGLLQARPAADRPIPSTLLYTLDRADDEALWLTQPDVDEDGESDDPARAWARTQVGASFTGTTRLDWFLQDAPVYPSTPARPVETPEPQVAVVRDTVTADGRRTRLALRSELGAEMLLLELPDPAVAQLLAVNGVALPEEGRRGGAVRTPTRVAHWGIPQDRILLDLAVTPDASLLELAVVEHHLRPQEILGETAWRRPPTLQANVARWSDRAIVRTPLQLALTAGGDAPGPEPGTEASDTLPVTPDTTAPPATPPDAAPDSASDPGSR